MNIKQSVYVSAYFMKLVWKINPRFLGLLIGSGVVNGIFPFVNVIVPMYIINELTGEGRVEYILKYIFIMVFMDALFYIVKQYIEYSKTLGNEKLMLDLQLDIGRRFADTDYQNLEDSQFMDLEAKALFPILKQNSLIHLFDDVSECIVHIIKIFGLLYLISVVNIGIAVFLLTSSVIYIWCHKKLAAVATCLFRELQPINRKFTYYIHMVTDYRRAMDIRLYHAEPMISERIGAYNLDSYKKLHGACEKNARYSCIGRGCVTCQKLVSYLYVTFLVISDRIQLGQFTMYINAIHQLTDSTIAIVNTAIDFGQNCDYLSDYLRLVELCEREEKQSGAASVPMPDSIESIEFRNVTFQYRNASSPVLKNVSFCIEKGKKMAITGVNGAGKTTIVKLIMRFFEPTEGAVYLNGINVGCFDLQEYMKKISAVFQDFFLVNTSIRDNIELGNNEDVELFRDAMSFSGMDEIVKDFEKAADTVLGKLFDESGIELSGGQRQKLAIARMLYRNKALVYLLDEPTAALDPKAEEEFYQKIGQFAENNKESILVLISHRLICSKYCDEIVVLNNGTVCEKGTHDELLERDGLYRKMWDAQREHYTMP